MKNDPNSKIFHVALGSFEIGNRTRPAMRFPGSPGSSGTVGRNRTKKFGLSASNEQSFGEKSAQKVIPSLKVVFSIAFVKGFPIENALICCGSTFLTEKLFV